MYARCAANAAAGAIVPVSTGYTGPLISDPTKDRSVNDSCAAPASVTSIPPRPWRAKYARWLSSAPPVIVISGRFGTRR